VAVTNERAVQALNRRRRISETLDALSESLRVPLLLRDADGFSYQEIAEHLGIGLSAAKMRIKRAREEFRRLFGTANGTEETDREADRVVGDAESIGVAASE
jgi:RNA polymerase sigma factor (sigma-70 family)